MDSGSCRSCGAPVLWVTMVSGKKMPLDQVPKKLVVLGPLPEQQGQVVDCYTSHFATCPNAAKHRQAK
jgi:hypothetical protein